MYKNGLLLLYNFAETFYPRKGTEKPPAKTGSCFDRGLFSVADAIFKIPTPRMPDKIVSKMDEIYAQIPAICKNHDGDRCLFSLSHVCSAGEERIGGG